MNKSKIINIGIIIVILLSAMFLNLDKVSAETSEIKINRTWMSGYFHARKNSSSYSRYGQLASWKTANDGSQAYCIAPGEDFVTSATYTAYSYDDSSDILSAINNTQAKAEYKLTQEQLDLISLYAYYGYGYQTHNTNQYLVATQMLIWRVVDPNQVFTNSNCTVNDCKAISDSAAGVADEIATIQALVDNHYVMPSFNGDSKNANVGELITYSDEFGVLSQYRVSSCTNCNAIISGNTLKVTINNKGNYAVNLEKLSNNYSTKLMFATNSKSQNQVISGNIDPLRVRISGTGTGGSITISKTDSESGSKLSNAKFGVYNSSDSLVCSITTDSNGAGGCSNLELGNYYLKEITAPSGYVIDNTKHNFSITLTNPNITLILNNNRVKGSVTISKSDSENGSKLSNAKFEVYNSSNKLVCSITTNANGAGGCTNLELGSYTLKEVKAPTGYKLNSKVHSFTISTTNVNITLNLTNERIKGNVNIIKSDIEDASKLSNAKFEVYNSSSNLICTIITNTNGAGSCSNLELGNYTLKEIEAPTGYILDSKVHNFTISENDTNIKIELTNEKIKGKVSVEKSDSKTSQKLSNAKFGVYDVNNKLICSFVTNSEGKGECTELLIGKYYLQEIETPVGYVINNKKYDFSINANSTDIKINVVNEKIKGSVEVYKLDNKNGKYTPQGDGTLEGAVFGIYTYDDNNALIATITTDSNGYARYDKLEYGRYYVKELEAPKGYKLARANHVFSIETNNEVKFVGIINTINSYKFSLLKTMSDGTSGVIETEADAEFDIYLKSKNKLVEKIITDSYGKASVTLPYGIYSVCQTKGNGYTLLADCFDVDLTKGDVEKVVNNEYIKAKLKVIKVDQNGDNISLSNIKFKIKNLNTNEYVCQILDKKTCEFKTNSEGILITPLPLLAGEYQLEEIDQSINGYLWNEQSLKFTIDENTNIIYDSELGAILEVKFSNQEVFGSIIIKKIGEIAKVENYNIIFNESNLENVKFEIYDESKKLVTSIVTNNNGIAAINNLKLGKYYIKEVEINNNYILDKNLYEIDLTYIDQYTPVVEKTITIKNYLKKGILEFTKKDLANGIVLPNVGFDIFNEYNELIFKGLTNKNGKIIINNLPIGKYYILETIPATGYVLNQEKVYFEIKNDSEIIKLELSNELIKNKIKLIKTDENNNTLRDIKFGLYNTKDELIGEYTTNEEGIIEFEATYGNYYLKEIATNEGYVLNNTKLEFNIEEDGKVIELQMSNEKIRGIVKLQKLGEEEVLSNVVFELYNNKDELIGEYTTNEEGIIEVELEYGKYYFIEKSTNEDYILNNTKLEFNIEEDDKVIELQMSNEKIRGIVKLQKLGEEEVLSNVVFELYNNKDELIGEYTTNEEGIIEVELEYGKYYFIEKSTNENYILNDGKIEFSILNDNDIINLEVKNYKIPKTYKIDTTIIAGSILGVLGAILTAYETYKIKRKK